MYNPTEILNIEKCDCGRPYCQFFGGGIGASGVSFSRIGLQDIIEDFKEIQNDIPKAIAHLESLLKSTK